MKASYRYCCLLLTIFTLSSCQYDSRKYSALLYTAANSEIIETRTPDGFSFNMTEREFNDTLIQRETSFTDSLMESRYKYVARYDWPLGAEHYAVGCNYSKEFRDKKLCGYEIEITGRIVNDKFILLAESDINAICDYYKTSLKKDFTLDSLDLDYGKTCVFTKKNMVITIYKVNDGHELKIKCENRPITAQKRKELEDFQNNEMIEESSSSASSITYVEVKNNHWDGGVKQVKEYLKYNYLRDPDSYESIEWSEVKRKDDGYYVRHKYRAKNGFGGYVVANQLFHLDFSGNVVDVKDLY